MSSENELAQIDSGERSAEAAHEAVEALDEGDSRRGFLKKAGLARRRGDGRRRPARRPHPGRRDGRRARADRPPASARATSASSTTPSPWSTWRPPSTTRRPPRTRNRSSSRPGAAFLKQTTADENAHVAFLKKALGSKAVGGPEGRLRRRHQQPRWLHQDRRGAGEHRRQGLLRPGAEHQQPGLHLRRALDLGGRGASRVGRRSAGEADPGKHLAERGLRQPQPLPKSSRPSKAPASSSNQTAKDDERTPCPTSDHSRSGSSSSSRSSSSGRKSCPTSGTRSARGSASSKAASAALTSRARSRSWRRASRHSA